MTTDNRITTPDNDPAFFGNTCSELKYKSGKYTTFKIWMLAFSAASPTFTMLYIAEGSVGNLLAWILFSLTPFPLLFLLFSVPITVGNIWGLLVFLRTERELNPLIIFNIILVFFLFFVLRTYSPY